MAQLYAVSACLLAGIAAGLLCEPLVAVSAVCKGRSKVCTMISDLLCGGVAAAVFVCVSAAFSLPDLRVYMFFFCGLGFLLWNRSFHRILAFFAIKLYNKYRSGCKRRWLRLTRKICRKKNLKKLS